MHLSSSRHTLLFPLYHVYFIDWFLSFLFSSCHSGVLTMLVALSVCVPLATIILHGIWFWHEPFLTCALTRVERLRHVKRGNVGNQFPGKSRVAISVMFCDVCLRWEKSVFFMYYRKIKGTTCSRPPMLWYYYDEFIF